MGAACMRPFRRLALSLPAAFSLVSGKELSRLRIPRLPSLPIAPLLSALPSLFAVLISSSAAASASLLPAALVVTEPFFALDALPATPALSIRG